MRFRVSYVHEVCHTEERACTLGIDNYYRSMNRCHPANDPGCSRSSFTPPCAVMWDTCRVEVEKRGQCNPLMNRKIICQTFDLQ